MEAKDRYLKVRGSVTAGEQRHELELWSDNQTDELTIQNTENPVHRMVVTGIGLKDIKEFIKTALLVLRECDL